MMRGAVLVAVAVVAAAIAGSADADPATPQDRAAIAACLKHVRDRLAAHTGSPGLQESDAARGADAAGCIGTVADACQEQPGGGSTHGMIDCNRRELAVWDERLNRFYRATLTTGGKIAAAVQRAERAWLAWRDARCAIPGVAEEGGSIVGPLETDCLYRETARQALWLEQLELYPVKGRP